VADERRLQGGRLSTSQGSQDPGGHPEHPARSHGVSLDIREWLTPRNGRTPPSLSASPTSTTTTNARSSWACSLHRPRRYLSGDAWTQSPSVPGNALRTRDVRQTAGARPAPDTSENVEDFLAEFRRAQSGPGVPTSVGDPGVRQVRLRGRSWGAISHWVDLPPPPATLHYMLRNGTRQISRSTSGSADLPITRTESAFDVTCHRCGRQAEAREIEIELPKALGQKNLMWTASPTAGGSRVPSCSTPPSLAVPVAWRRRSTSPFRW
jgi:hypothetical protein